MTKRTITVYRRGHHRRGYRRRDGTYVRPTSVKPSTFQRSDIGAPGKGPRLIKVRPGMMKGYSTSMSKVQRRKVLAKLVKKYGATKVWKMLHAQVVFRKRQQHTAAYKAFKIDRDYVKSRYNPDLTPRKAIKKWKGLSHKERARRMPG